jgi:hypothetical protein
LDAYLTDALLTYGENDEYLTCSAGVFAYTIDAGQLIIKTYINFELLSEEQLHTFYGPGTVTMLPDEFLAENNSESDFMLAEEYASPPRKQ